MFKTLRQFAGNLLRHLAGEKERESGRHFDRVERDLAVHDNDLIRQRYDDLSPRQQRWLDWAGDILANPDSPDKKVGEAIDALRQISRTLPIGGLLIVTLRLDDPAYENARLLPAISRDWLTHDVRRVAEAIYQQRWFVDLPVLADALEEAGCTDPGILGPMRRQPTPHIRGVRALYALLNIV